MYGVKYIDLVSLASLAPVISHNRHCAHDPAIILTPFPYGPITTGIAHMIQLDSEVANMEFEFEPQESDDDLDPEAEAEADDGMPLIN